MLQPVKAFFNQTRTFIHRSAPKSWEKDGKKYGLITYYPRHKDHVDPPITPTKLLHVERVKRFRGNPYWEKQVLISFGLKEKRDKTKVECIVKNTPEICAMLWTVKHLIKVTPIQLPEHLPDDINSVSTYLQENGKLLVFPKIDEKRYKATEDFINNPKKLDPDTIKERLRLKWLSGMDSTSVV